MNESGLIERINSNRGLYLDHRIVPCKFSGLSPTHFNIDGTNHIWNGVARVDSTGKIQDRVYVDAAFQKIVLKYEEPYIPMAIIADVEELHFPRNNEIPIGSIEQIGDSTTIKNRYGCVLGISSKFSTIFSICVLRNMATQKLTPAVKALNSDHEEQLFYLGDNGHLVELGNVEIPQDDKLEAQKLLALAGKLQFQPTEKPTTGSISWYK